MVFGLLDGKVDIEYDDGDKETDGPGKGGVEVGRVNCVAKVVVS